MRYLIFALILCACSVVASAQNSSTPFRVGIVGLVHGHVGGFFEHSLHLPEIQVVGIAEPDQALVARYAQKFSY